MQEPISLSSQATEQLVQGLPGLCGMVLAMILFCLSGALLSRDRSPLLMVIRGWALATVLAISLPLIGFQSLTAVLSILVFAAIGGSFALVRIPIDARGLGPALLLGLPLVLLSTIVPSTYWDSYTQWLPNASYLFQMDQLIAAPLPDGFYSRHPTYPPGLALPVYFASRITGHFASGAAHAFGSLLLVLAVPRFMIVLGEAKGPLQATVVNRPWTCALLVLSCLVLVNPAVHNFDFAFTQQGLHYWSFLADSVLAIIVLVLIQLLAEELTPESVRPTPTRDRRRVEVSSLIALGIVASALKLEAGITVFAVLGAAGLIAVTSSADWHRMWRTFGSVATGVILAAVLWRFYCVRFLPIGDQFGIHRYGWRFDLVPALLSSAWSVVIDFWLVYALSAIAILAALYRLLVFRRTSAIQPLQFALAVSGMTLLGHILVTVIAYVTTGFADWEISGAHSWQRYISHVAFSTCALTLMAGLCAVPWPWRLFNLSRELRIVLGVGVAVFAYTPMAMSAVGELRYYSAQRQEIRQLSLNSITHLPPHTRVAVMGDEWSRIFFLYSAWADVDATRRPWMTEFFEVANFSGLPKARARLERWLHNESIECVLILDAVDFTASANLPPAPDLVRCAPDGEWRVIELGRRNVHRLM
jgi:hypothetical protein